LESHSAVLHRRFRALVAVALLAAGSSVRAEPVPRMADGAILARVTPEDAQRDGLTLLSLGDDWAPGVFGSGPEGTGPAYRETFVALANGKLGEGPGAIRPLYDRHLELHGIPPTFTLLRGRLDDAERHACRDTVDDAALHAMTGVQRPWEPPERQKARQKANTLLGERLERERERLGLASLADLAADKRYTARVAAYQAEEGRFEAVRALQRHLRCEGTLTGPVDGLYAGVTQYALGLFQRQHMLPSKGLLDADTRAALLADSRELDFQAVLRVLRERVADAAGLIEDGTAQGSAGTHAILGRALNVDRMGPDDTRPPIPGGAPDLIGEATEAAAKALGLTSPEAARQALASLTAHGIERVAVALPPPPAWHRDTMTLRGEVDRGDVYMAWPYGPDGRRKTFAVARRPVLTLYARPAPGEPEVALVRWPTTIGGWQREKRPGGAMVRKYKESPVGPRVWRRLVVAPAWLPPDTTPPQELVRKQPEGWVVDAETMGPGYASAYGLVMLVNETVGARRGRPPVYGDQGVRVHGSVSYASIGRGESHGCHRLYNHLALRLAGFVLRHHAHRHTGALAVRYGLRFRYQGQTFEHRIADRGYEILLEPPVPVEVLPGQVHRSLPRGAR
jgi:hypothetical protein